MPTLLLSDGLQPEADELAALAERAGWNVYWPADFREDGSDCAYYGDTLAGARLAGSGNFSLIEPTFDLLTQIPGRYTKRRIEYMTLSEALGRKLPFFIKSADACNRCMDSAILEAGASLRQYRGLSPDTPVLIAEPVTWIVEYRMIVLERSIITYAPYMQHGERAKVGQQEWAYDENEAAGIVAACRDFLGDPAVSLPPAFTLDAGWIENRGWAVVEFNPVWCSRLFGCDRRRLLPVLRRACLRKEQVNGTDAQWVLR